MTNHADHAFIHELLRDLNRDARVGLVVLHVEHELDGLARDGRMLRIFFIERELRAVLQILADPRNRSRQRADKAYLDDFRIRGKCKRSMRRQSANR
ncbi:hypothetical protein CBA19C8_26715 [Paraburkholderia terrae]|nr:hypothetical protein CBA19C8_26715 [Paraburkholderia terrae]